jgi:hypothetical protein
MFCRYRFFLFVLLFVPVFLFAQIKPANQDAPVLVRNVLGIVKDSTSESVIGAAVTLYSKTDTLRTATNQEGIFFFKNVKDNVFTIKVDALGFAPKIINGSYSDIKKEITLDPIVLSTNSQILKTVIVNGTPTIIYKTDTVEYRAKDYILRAGATIDELLKKMEGVDVEKDGTVSTNGQKVEAAKLNGREIFGGNVAPTIKNLPADIVDKIQFIDDYGEAAAITGVKDGAAKKVLNITTKTEKSVGNMLRFDVGLATQNQLEGNANYTRINKNQTITADLTSSKFLAGLPGVYNNNGNLGSAAYEKPKILASNGKLTSVKPSFSFNQQYNNKLNVNFRYNFNNNVKDIMTISNGLNNSILGLINNNNQVNNQVNLNEHSTNLILDYKIDSVNFLQLTPKFTYTQNNTNLKANLQQTGLIQQIQNDINSNSKNNCLFNNTIGYQHLWKRNKKKTLAVEAYFQNQNFENLYNQNSNILYFQNNSLAKDSVLKNAIVDSYQLTQFRNKITFTQPVYKNSRLVFAQTLDLKNYSNVKTTSLTNANLELNKIDSLSNNFSYRFKQYKSTINYQFVNAKKNINATIGFNYLLSSFQYGDNNSTNFNQPQSHAFPTFRLDYNLSLTKRILIYYQGNVLEPNLNQLQPVRDITNPQNNILGNPNLKFGQSHNVYTDFSNYISYSKISYNLSLVNTINKGLVGTNIVQVLDNYGSLKNQTQYVNLSGNQLHSLNYNLTKQLNNRKYSVSFKGNISQNYLPFLSNNVFNKAVESNYKQTLAALLNPTSKIEINPSIMLDYTTTSFSLANTNNLKQSILGFGLDGRLELTESFLFSYAISKNYISGIANNQTQNPLICNLQIRNQFLNKKFSLGLSTYDIFNQNKFVIRNVNADGFTEVLTNPNSRYLMLNIKYNLQKWTSAKAKNGEQIKRKGDGSFFN